VDWFHTNTNLTKTKLNYKISIPVPNTATGDWNLFSIFSVGHKP